MNRLYVYLARRDKKGVQVLTVVNGTFSGISRLPDVNVLNLSVEMTNELKNVINDYRMLWEPWIANADSYQELRVALLKRGYSSLPSHSKPLYAGTSLRTPPVANVKKINERPTMVQKQTLSNSNEKFLYNK